MKEYFKDHTIKTILVNEHVSRYEFSQPGTWNLRMFLTFADNMILLQGDCYSMLWEPGYGRNGLAFLRGSIKSTGYFMEKCPFHDETVEYSYERAKENLKESLDEDILQEALEHLSDETGVYGEVSYYEVCADYDIDEPSSPFVATKTAQLQLAGLESFVEAYEEMIKPKPRVIDELDLKLSWGPV